MLYPSVFHRVRMIGRVDDFVIARVDHTASVVDLCAVAGQTAMERSVPFCQLYAFAELDQASYACSAHEDRLTQVDEILRSSNVQLLQSQAALADTHDLITATMHIIRVSKRLIASSDELVAGVRNVDEQRD